MVQNAVCDGATSRKAFGSLLSTYWYPCYAFLRRKNHNSHDAEDLIQQFFAWLIEQNLIARADPGRGRFRSFLIRSLEQFVQREYRNQNAAKRKPDGQLLSIDVIREGEKRYACEPASDSSAEKLYDYTWATQIVRTSLEQLRSEYEAKGKLEQFELLQDFLSGHRSLSGRQIAAKLDVSEIAVRALVFRFKQKLSRVISQEVANTLGQDDDIDEELAELQRCLDWNP